MTRGEFEKLTERYNAGECTPEEIAFVEKWVELNCRRDEQVPVFENEVDAAVTEAEIWDKVRNEAGLMPKTRSLGKYAFWLPAGIAACIAFVVLLNFLIPNLFDKPEKTQVIGLETHNTSTSSQRIVLPDSSVVVLAGGAKILTSETYGEQTRAVHLTGEAFFEVRPNPKLPFVVYSGDLVTEVLGTSFHVKSGQGKNTIEVAVVTGKVSVYTSEKDRNQRRSGVIITPNQKVVYNTESKTIRQDLVDDPQIVIENTPKSAFLFDETPVTQVVSTLQEAYGMEIVVSNPELNECKFTGNLNGFDLFKQLNYICDVINAQYEVRGSTIFLTGKGCAIAH
jgi:transmembrane sensor